MSEVNEANGQSCKSAWLAENHTKAIFSGAFRIE